MEEIKFRGWHKKRKKYYKVLHLHLENCMNEGIWATCEGYNVIEQKEINIQIQPNDITVEQFTGLKDKNDKEIYEGDIIEFTYWWFDGNEAESNLTGVIVYSNECMSFQLKGVKNKEWESFTGYENDTDYLTPFSELNFDQADFGVIGNIHENPELNQ